MSIFDGMTNLYSLSKTLRFELKPVPKTKEFIEQSNFFKKDMEKADAYPVLKQLLDDLHRDFINKSLAKVTTLSIDKESDFKKLRKEITKHFVDAKKLGEKDVVNQLISNNPNHAQQIEQFRWFRWYFWTYKKNRENLYKDEGNAWQIATRLIDENLPRFLKNKEIVLQILTWFNDFEVIEKNERQEQTNKKLSDYSHFFDTTKYHLHLTQPSIDVYNQIVGHINHSINLYKQQHSGVKIPLLQILYKLPLAPRESVHWLPQQLENNAQLLQTVDAVKERIDKSIIPFIQSVLQPALSLKTAYDLRGVYVSIKTLELWWGIWLTGWMSFRELTYDPSKWGDEPKLRKEYKDFTFVSLYQVKEFLDLKQQSWIDATAVFGEEKSKSIWTKWFSEYFFEFIYDHVSTLIASYQEARNWYIWIVNKDNQKKLMDTSLTLWRLLGWFVLMHKKVRLNPDVKESHFYDGEQGLDAIVFDDNLDPIHTSYDKVRNYLTKKPYSNDEKIKVNFESPDLLNGWDQNKEATNLWIILRKDEMYYLVLMKKWINTFFDKVKNPNLYVWTGYEKMVYKQIADPSKDIPGLMEINGKTVKKVWKKDSDGANRMLEEFKNIYLPPEINLIRRSRSYLESSDIFSKLDLSKFINYYKERMTSYYKGRFQFKFQETYDSRPNFIEDIKSQSYKLTRDVLDKDLIEKAVQNWELYLFQIYNKDFSANATWSKNVHTSYFQALFTWGEENLFKLNGEAELFWRKGILEKKVREKSPKHKVDVIEKKRYTENKLMFHVPITLNFCREEFRVNDITKKVIKNNVSDVTILWIDRGEKHLLYYSLIRLDGTIIKTGSWNVIQNGIKKVPYHQKLNEREWKRDQAQLNWDQQEQIKDLKKGYISQVIHEICNIVIQHNAIIVLEDLNGGFKRWRQKVEKNVYQQFELALAKKLNYLVFKKNPEDQTGGTMKWYQLTPQVSWFGDLKFQTGIMFYTPAGYTSTTCPCCGWRKHLYLKYNNEKTAKFELSKIMISKNDGNYLIDYIVPEDIRKAKTNIKLLKTHRRLTSKDQLRSQYNISTKQDITYVITEELDKLFGPWNLDYIGWIQEASVSQCKSLIRLLNLLMKMRNPKSGTDIDIIQCPACDFHSDKWLQSQPYNWDANGAYNIARKWSIIIEKILHDEKSTAVSQRECDNKRSS